jgi:hypothetical protein
MIEIFKTNVEEAWHAKNVVALLVQHFPGRKINFDLHDCDKILRVEGESFAADRVIGLVAESGFTCVVLE